MEPAPRILNITGHTHPKALVERVDLAGGFLTFARLDAAGNKVDTGGSVVRFTPVTQIVDGQTVPADPGDAAFIAAIQAPPPSTTITVVLTPLEIRSRLTPAELVALDTSTDAEVIIVRNNLIAASEVRSDDPRTAVGKGILVAKGVLTQSRADAVFA